MDKKIEYKKGRSLWGIAFTELMKDRIAVISLIVILIYAVTAVITPFIFPDWETLSDYPNRNLPPSPDHPFGTDALGRSVLIKTLLGAHVSMVVAFFSNVIAIPLGMLLGAISGYYGKKLDDVIVWFYSTVASIPGLILLIALKFAFQNKVIFEDTLFELDFDGIAGVIIVLGITSWISTCRLVRAETMKIKELEYVQAAVTSGRKSFSILIKHILPNVMHIGIISFSLGFVNAIMAEVILSFLNIGVMDLPSWGKMINQSRLDLVVGRWWELTSAVTATFFIVLSWNLFGDRLRDALDPKLGISSGRKT